MADMPRKTPRRTRERILERALSLFNDFGEPNVSTAVLADELEISPGNLYYHFRNKDEIVNSLFSEFETAILDLLAVPERPRTMGEVHDHLLKLFELAWRYRFFYRDLNDMLSRNRTLELHFRQIFDHKTRLAAQLCRRLRGAGLLDLDEQRIAPLATNMAVVASYWLSYEFVLDPRHYGEPQAVPQALQRGCAQVLLLIAPYLKGSAADEWAALPPAPPFRPLPGAAPGPAPGRPAGADARPAAPRAEGAAPLSDDTP